MKINYKGNFQQIVTAVEDANEILYLKEFYDLIKESDEFKCAKKTPSEIADILFNSDLEVEVQLYKPKWRYSKVLGYFVKSKPFTLFLNYRKIYRETNAISNTIIHEYIHAVDYHNNNNIIDFGHNCGVFEGTAPYVIGNLAESIIDGYQVENTSDLYPSQEIEIFESRIIK